MPARSCSRKRRRAHLLGPLGLLLAASAAPATASGVRVHASGLGHPDTTAFDLQLVREDLEVDYDDSDEPQTLELRRIGISFYDTLGAHVRGAVRLGGAGFRQSGRAATAGLEPTGFYLEIDIEGVWPAATRLQGVAAATWRHTEVDADFDDDSGKVDVEWDLLELRPGLRLRFASRLELTLGATALAIDGSEAVDGPARSTTGFSAEDRAGAFATLAYDDGNDRVSLRVRGGNPEGLLVAFEHRF